LRTSLAPTQTPANLLSLMGNMPVGSILSVVNQLLAEKDFSQFVRQAWDVVEPGRPFIWGWHLQAKCDHLQSVYNFTVPDHIDSEAKNHPGIQRLIINEPPRCSKSLILSVMFNAWVWAKWPGARFLYVTYADDLAQRDALKTRQLIESPWYQQRWPIRVSAEQSAKSRFNIQALNDKGTYEDVGGFRVSTTILGIATGEGADFRGIDDPHNVKKSLSDVERKQANTFLDLTLPTRVVDPNRSSTVICMQRLHEDDATGHLLQGENKYDHLCLPMEYSTQIGNQCRTSLGFKDPRTVDGELLHPERWTSIAVEELKSDLRMELGDFGVNSQLQQRPTPLGGGMFKTENLVPVTSWPSLNDLDKVIRYWDKAGTEGSGAYTAGALMAKNKITQRTIILDVIRGQWATEKREEIIKTTAYQDVRRLGGDHRRYAVRVEQEPGSGGKDSAMWTVHNLAGFNASAVRKTLSKEADWAPLSSQVNAGGVEILIAPWNQVLKQELASAPFGKFKDQIDACSGGFRYIWLGSKAGFLG
jgi:predicted phage terminase large subunit-like protein